MEADLLNITKDHFFQKRMLEDHDNLHISNDELVKIQDENFVQNNFLNQITKDLDFSNDATILCQSKIKNPNFFSIIYSNKAFQELFDVLNEDIFGKSYDFLLEEFNLDYSSEDQIEYFRLIKDIKDFHPCSIIVSIPGQDNAGNDHDKKRFKIDFKPDNFIDDLGRRHAKFVFHRISKLDEESKKSFNKNNTYDEMSAKQKSRQESETLLKGIERALHNERLLRKIASFIISDMPIDEIANKVAKSICQHFRVDRCIIHDYRSSQTSFVVEYCDTNIKNIFDNNNPNRIKLLTKYIDFQNAFYKKHSGKDSKSWVAIANNIAEDNNFYDIRDICKDFQIATQIAVTTVFNNEVNGGIYIHQSQNRSWLADEIEVIEMIADQLSIAIDRSVSVEKVMVSNHALMEKTVELRQALKKEQEMRKMQNEFVALVSHEFKTPLQIIDGTRELLHRKVKNINLQDPSIEKCFDRIKSGIQRMNGLIGSTLNLARMESSDGKINIEASDFDIQKFIYDIIDKNSNLAQNRNIKFLINIKDLPQKISGDPKLLEHSFNNIISNAIKYSKNNGSVKIIAKSNNEKIAIRVVDSGIGIPKDDLRNIGQKFFRANNTLSDAGTGIGLYLSKNFINLHGGNLVIDSEIDVGTSITVTLPR